MVKTKFLLMKKYTQKELNEIIQLHKLWLENKEGGIRANLIGSDLSGSNLRGSNLRGSNLSGSNLSGSNLSGSDLSGSNLSGSDLSGSDLSGSNLSGSDLSGSEKENSIKMPIYCKWTHGITNENLIHIGCEKRTIEEWEKFFKSTDIISTERNTEEFKQIEAVYNAYKAYLITLSK